LPGIPPVGAGAGLAGAGAGAAAFLALRAGFRFALDFALFAFIPFFFRAGAARFAVFFAFFAFAFLRFFAMVIVLPEMVQPATQDDWRDRRRFRFARTPLP
jgi:hypothetical protein